MRQTRSTNERVMQLIREAHEKNLTDLFLDGNRLTQPPPGIEELENLTELNLSTNQFADNYQQKL